MEEIIREEKPKAKSSLERKSEQILEPRSMVVRISSGSVPWEIFVAIRELDRQLNRLVRNAGFTIPVPEVEEKIKLARKLADDLWQEVKRVTPALFDFNPDRWFYLNESYEEKHKMVRVGNTAVFIPRLDETARIMMAFKVLARRRFELSSVGDLETLGKVAQVYKTFHERIKELSQEIDSGNQV